MEKFYGFDLGDAESAVCLLENDKGEPRVIPIRGSRSLVSAYARLGGQEILIGENACYHPRAVERRIRFKSRFLTDDESARDIRYFAQGVLGELTEDGVLIRSEDSCFYVGCPAGWDKNAREKYRQIFERAGFPPVRIISESRAALVSACQSRYMQVGYDILSQPVLVVDMGSSTTDFAYISGGHEVELRTAGEVFLGGGLMDEFLLDECVEQSPESGRIRQIFLENPSWRSYCEFAARRLKEKYYSDEEYWKKNECLHTVQILAGPAPLPLTLRMNGDVAERMLYGKLPALAGSSFYEAFIRSLESTREGTQEKPPELIFLTGGVSRLPALAGWCREVYPDAVVITGTEPEFSVSKGLAWCGSIDEKMRQFHAEVESLRDSTTVEQIVGRHISELYHGVVETMTEPIIANAVLPVIDRWRAGKIARLVDVEDELEKEITAWLHTAEARELLHRPVAVWLKPIAYELEEYTVPICVRHGVPHRALSLTSWLSLAEIDIHVDAKDVFAVEEITWMIDTIITIVAGLLCGGGGIAMIANGLPGIIAGAVISVLVLFLGREKMQDVLLRTNIPGPMRRLLPRSSFEGRMKKITAQVKESIYQSLEKDKNEEISDSLVTEISAQIDECLVRMAEVVEIPLSIS
ncbi:MAG: Hsp70 family protein [Blautia sp.]|nr:Hsp70 family protein [Blautia sp.]